VKQIYSQVRAAGGEVLAVSFTKPALAATILQRDPLPFPAVCDPTLQAYQTFGLGRASWRSLFRPRVIGQYLRVLLRGWLPRKLSKEEDVLQLGGDFVLDRDRRLVYAHRSIEPTDRPKPAALLDAVRRAEANRHAALTDR
jgi:peroxiredoxin